MIFGDRLTELRKENGFKTRKEFCEIIGIPETTLRNYEKGEREPGHVFIKQMSEFFNVSADYLLGLTDIKTILPNLDISKSEALMIEKYNKLDTHGRQVVSFLLDAEYERVRDIMAAIQGEASGTSGTIAVPLLRDALSRKEVGTIPVTASGEIRSDERDLVALPVTEDTMAPLLNPGDKLIVRQQSSLDREDFAVVLLDGVQVVCKKVVKEGDSFRLFPLDKKLEEMVIHKDEIKKKRFEIVGRVVKTIQAG